MDAFDGSIADTLKQLEELGKNGGGFGRIESGDSAHPRDDASCDHDDWYVDVERGMRVCVCGLCEAGVFINQHSFRERADAFRDDHRLLDEDPRWVGGYEDAAGTGVGASVTPYQHEMYFDVRLRHWAMQERKIAGEAWESIVEEFQRRYPSATIPTTEQLSGAREPIEGAVVLTKPDVHAILLACDTTEQKAIFRSTETKFVRRFLRRWLSIRFRLSGKSSTYHKCPVWMLELVKERFPKVLTFFSSHYQSKSHITFPSYDFVIRRLLDLCGGGEYAVDFDVARSEKKRWALNAFWLAVCKFYWWPYINTDE